MSSPPIVVQFFLLLFVIPAAIFDVWRRRVPNWITLPALLLAIGLNCFLYETPGLWFSLEGVGLALLIYFPLYVLRGMGAGDVKLMAAIGAAVGWPDCIGILFLTTFFGSVAAIVAITRRHRLGETFRNMSLIVLSIVHRQAPYEVDPELDVKSDRSVRLPHAVSIACGVVAFLTAAAIWAPK
jgi:prepilin peptidase CpaA